MILKKTLLLGAVLCLVATALAQDNRGTAGGPSWEVTGCRSFRPAVFGDSV
jgi:hypothetical protein